MEQMTEQLLLGGRVKHNDFTALIKAYKIPPGAATLMLLEIEPRYVVEPKARQNLLLFEQFNPKAAFTLYTSGRIFHTQGELRWERQHTDIQVVYTGEREYGPKLNESEEWTLDGYDSVTKSYLLFGKRLDEGQRERIPTAQPGDFAEVRIPRLLRYPSLEELKGAEYIQLAVCEYMDRVTGANIAYRFKKLVPFQKSQEQKTL
jgi:hypothetical protein